MDETYETCLIRLRPRDDVVYISQNRSVLATGRDGFVDGGPERGLFVHQTRLLSRYRYLVDGQPPQPQALSNVEQHSWLGYYITRPPDPCGGDQCNTLGPGDPTARGTVELRISRVLGDGLHEDVDLTNFGQRSVAFTLQLDLDADFADKDETAGRRQQDGRISRTWRRVGEGVWELNLDYREEHSYDHQGNAGVARIHRGVRIHIERADSAPAYERGQIRFPIELAPHGIWHSCINVVPIIEGRVLPVLYPCRALAGTHNDYDRCRQRFLRESTAFAAPTSRTLSHVVIGTLEQARRDLAALRLHDLDQGERAWTVAAGLPGYLGLFGRDTLTAAWQAALIGPELMRGTLAELSRWQGSEVNDWRDEQPGKMLHQADTGPLASLGFNPLARYYGSITTSGFYPVVVSELWHWTGDKELIRPLIGPALKGLRWLDEYGDLDGYGFYEYLTRSEQGLKHQAWKDSGDAIVHEDGSAAQPPIATCEEQGFVYLAKLHQSEVLWWLDEKAQARRLYAEAEELKKRFHDAFWMEEEGFLALGLDAHKRQISSIGSNAGHCLATAVVDQQAARRIADRLLEDDLFSGWGVRTLSSRHPAYDPFSYHRGSVWPVEQGTFAIAFQRYGLHGHLQRLCHALFEAAAIFDAFRLPEVFSGHQRDADHPFPAHYPGANAPQAWSASAVFCLLQALLGLYPYAPLDVLLIDPHLPEWLPEITLQKLRVGSGATTIRFYRRQDGSSGYEVLEKWGTLHVVRQPSPRSLTATFAERLSDALSSLLPGR
ncbi:amylo-alpha-1,6-glucosidase [Tautonia sociabilis]|uniref:Amylo-alpha-1,6-glucosidase n=1 Tax=Tautonia sociabilis TaxID=2080755 RepID=A0A432MLH8_9BACT|nr:glycogen debranching N-terminal domain-containing protein [Tautonia sociabilis]RUL87948.1 amylo-alpha-1,6-glucosidase [Tautonia sociabilis]